ncbi:MAG: hypothetical protein LBU88_03615 [Treponema sp.]|jgi:hypothetical protein|nr:hypothetical protein [Treponema sp.]
MEIKVNGKAIDYTLENEKTISEIIVSLEQWITGSGHRMSGLSIDGKTAGSSSLEDFLSRDIDSVNTLEIITSSNADLAAESLVKILDNINEFQTLKHEDKNSFLENWKQSPQANFTAESMPDLYSVLTGSFSGSGLNLNSAFSITEERLREIKDPKAELENLKPLFDETCTRLADLSLDVQTGKDARAAQTIQLFSGITEKMLRLSSQLDIQGYLTEAKDTVNQIINELGDIIKELLNAYERHDTVLVGDLAEYEACGKLQELYTAIKGDK